MNLHFLEQFKGFLIKIIFLQLARFADTVAAWSWSKYHKSHLSNRVSSCEVEKYTQDIWTKSHHIVVDEPLHLGGNNLGATPFELLQAALASCTSITLRMYCEKKSINLEHLSVDVTKENIEQVKINEGKSKTRKTQRYLITLNIKGNLSEQDKKRLIKIAAKCPVHLALKTLPQFKIDIS